MAKLLRITTDEEDARFDVALDDGFDLPPNSTVALQSANFTYDTGQLTITPSNERFEMEFGGSTKVPVFILDLHHFFNAEESATYNATNYTQLLSNMEASINHLIYDAAIAETEIGYQARLQVNNKHKVQVDMERAPLLDWNNSTQAVQLQFNQIDIAAGFGNGFKLGAPIAGLLHNDGFVLDRMEWNRGGNYARCRIHNMIDGGGNNNFTFGVVEEDQLIDFVPNAPMSSQINFVFAVQCTGATSRINMVTSLVDGSDTKLLDTGTVPNATTGGGANNHDAFTITTSNGKFVLTHYTSVAPGGVELNPIFTAGENPRDYGKYNPNKRYYLAFLIEDNDDRTTNIDMVGGINNPYAKRTTQPVVSTFTNKLQTHENVMALASVPDIPSTAQTFQLSFTITETGTNNIINNTELRDFLGYSNISINPTPTIASDVYNLVADNTSLGFVKSQTFVIQLINLPVESYDSISRKKENTIYTIVENTLVNVSQEVSFNSSYPIYIALKNKNSILLRRIGARILDHNLQPLSFRGQSQLTLLFGE